MPNTSDLIHLFCNGYLVFFQTSSYQTIFKAYQTHRLCRHKLGKKLEFMTDIADYTNIVTPQWNSILTKVVTISYKM